MHLFEEPTEPLGHSDKRRLQVLELIAPDDSFQQPGAERIEMLDTGKVNDHTFFLCIDCRKSCREALKRDRLRGGPRAACNQACRRHAAGECRIAHRSPSICRCYVAPM